MFTKHYDKFNESINAHGANASAEEHESVLYQEGKMYDLIKEYIDAIDTATCQQLDWYLRHIRHHISAILAYVGLDIDADYVMFEAIDVQSARLAA